MAKGDRSDPSWKAAELARLGDPVNDVTKTAAPILLAHSSIDSVVAVEQSERLYRKYLENGLDASLFLWSRGAHGAVGLDIEAASSEWLARKLLVELAPKRSPPDPPPLVDHLPAVTSTRVRVCTRAPRTPQGVPARAAGDRSADGSLLDVVDGGQ